MKISTQKIVSIALVSAFVSGTSLFAQQKCGSTEARQELIKLDPSILEKEAQYDSDLQEYISSQRPSSGTESAEQIYVIPVVFHILHQYGAENISDAQILNQMEILNRDFRKLNPDTTQILPLFQPIAADCGIEFRLATKDPQGNCTNGIDRIYTHKTNYAGDESKLNQWDPKKYLNVWVVRSIGSPGSTTAGYAYYPSAVDGLGFWRDGIIILHNFIGSVGTGTPTNSRALTHEIGHWLNLPHPWGSNNENNVACGDDGVHDTPETKGAPTGVCVLGTAFCNPPDTENVQNFMDYSYCSRMFTQGQKTRMRAALSFPVAGRNNLWTTANLIATGTDTPPATACLPIADFSASSYMICQGTSIALISSHAHDATPTNIEWTIPDGAPSTSTLSVVSVNYATPSWKSVSLKATNATGNTTFTRNNYIYVSPTAAAFQGNYSDSFEDPAHFGNFWVHNNAAYTNASEWQITSSAAYSGARSLMLTSDASAQYSNGVLINPNVGAYDVDRIVSPALDMSWLSGLSLNFRLAYATKASVATEATESLKIYYSFNCGQNWSAAIYSKTGSALVTAGYSSTPYVPTTTAEWRYETVNLPSLLNNKTNVRFMIEYTSGNFSNNLYIDDFNITGTVGLEDAPSGVMSVKVYPNPSSGNTNLTYNLSKSQNIEIEVTDMLGHKVFVVNNQFKAAGEWSVSLPTEGLEAGVYFVRLVADNKAVSTQKLIIAH